MKLTIDIDENLLEGIKSDDFDFARRVVKNFQATIASAIANGIPISDNAMFEGWTCLECEKVEQELCDDAISREALLKKQYRIDDSATLSTRDVVNVEDIEDAPSVMQKPTECEDAISKKAVLKRIAQFSIEEGSSVICQSLYSDVNNMPPVIPSRRKGHWIKKDYWKPLPFDTDPLDWDNYDEETHSEKISLWYCSECDANKGENRPVAKFCEDCGAEMEIENANSN